MAAVFNRQDLFLEELAFAWPQETAILECISQDEEANRKLTATNHAGSYINVRRPSWVQAYVDPNTTGSVAPNAQTGTTDFYDESLASGVYTTATGFQSLQQASVPLVINHVIRADVEVSAQRLTQSLTRDQIRNEFIEPLMTSASEQIQKAVLDDINAYAGSAVVASSSYSSDYQKAVQDVIGQAGSIQRARKGIGMVHDGVFLSNQDVLYKFGIGVATNYHATDNPTKIQESGAWGGTRINGFRPLTSPLVTSKTLPAQLSAVTVAAAGGGVTNGLTAYAQTFQVNLTGLGAGYVVQKGLKLYFQNASTSANVNWVIPTTKDDTGKVATFSVVSSVTADGSGNATVTLSGPAIYSGPSRNISITTVLTGYKVFIVGAAVGASTVTPAYIINPKAVVGAWQQYDVPIGTPWSKHVRTKNGARFTLMIDRYPGTQQSVLSLRGFFGTALRAEEGVTVGYGI